MDRDAIIKMELKFKEKIGCTTPQASKMLADEFCGRLWVKRSDKDSKKNCKNIGFPLKSVPADKHLVCERGTLFIEKETIMWCIKKPLNNHQNVYP